MELTITGTQPADKLTAKPVMDIKAPLHTSTMEPVKAPPPQPGDPLPESVDLKQASTKPTKAPKPPRPRGTGMGLAISATVVIILGLGAMFVYAYLQTAR